MVYYDFDFALKEIEGFLKGFLPQKVDRDIGKPCDDYLINYSNCISSCRFYIDREWISNTAKLSTSMKIEEIKKYIVYMENYLIFKYHMTI